MSDAAAVSSTATEVPTVAQQALSVDDFDSYHAARVAERAGKPLEPKIADSASAPSVEQAASTDATPQPASEPGDAKGKGAKARNQELDAEIQGLQDRLKLRKALREELSQLEQGGKTADTPAATSAAPKRELDRFKSMPDYPKADEYEDYDDLVTARADFVASKRLEESRQRDQQERQHGEVAKAQQTMVERGRKDFADFDAVLTAAEAAGVLFPPHVGQKILTHEQGHLIAHALAKQANDAALWASLADPIEAGIIIGRILSGATPAKPSSVPQITKAPDPPAMLGTKTSDSSDPLVAAMSADDFDGYHRERLRQRVAALR